MHLGMLFKQEYGITLNNIGIQVCTMNHWKSLLIHPKTTMEEAIQVLNLGAERIALVVDEHCRLLGTVTDGDIRRALINHMTMATPVECMMCSTPQKAMMDWSRQRIQSTLENYKILQIPVVDEQNRVMDLHTLHDLLKEKRLENPIFLMAGGFGSRLYPLTEHCPKPMLKVGDKPILEIILERFIAAGFYRFFISTHYMHQVIQHYFDDGSQWGVSIRYLNEESPLGTAGALGLFPHEELDHPIFLMNADLLTHVNLTSLLTFYHQNPSIATMGVRQYEYSIPYGVVQSRDHDIISMVEKPVQRFFINAGIYLVSPDLVKKVPRNLNIDMPTLLQNQIQEGYRVTMFPIHEYWLDIGRMEDFQLAQHEYKVQNA